MIAMPKPKFFLPRNILNLVFQISAVFIESGPNLTRIFGHYFAIYKVSLIHQSQLYLFQIEFPIWKENYTHTDRLVIGIYFHVPCLLCCLSFSFAPKPELIFRILLHRIYPSHCQCCCVYDCLLFSWINKRRKKLKACAKREEKTFDDVKSRVLLSFVIVVVACQRKYATKNW